MKNSKKIEFKNYQKPARWSIKNKILIEEVLKYKTSKNLKRTSFSVKIIKETI